MDADDVPWHLGAVVSPNDAAAKVGFTLLRELSREESDQAQESAQFLERLAAAGGYPQLVEAYQLLEEAVKRQSTPERKVLELNETVRALGAIAVDIPERLKRTAEEDFEEASTQRTQVEAAIAEETARPVFQLLVAVRLLDIDLFSLQSAGIAVEPTALARLADTVEGIGPGLDLMASLYNGVVVAQRLIGRQLQVYAELIASHSLRLRQLAAEVPDGMACLLRQRPTETNAGSGAKTTMNVVALPLDKGVVLHRALSFTEHLLKSSSGTHIRSAGPPASGLYRPGTPPSPGSAEADDEVVPRLVEGAGTLNDRALDMATLARHATVFCDELERAWSGALDHALLAEAQQETQARYASLLAASQRHAKACDQVLREAGTDPGLPAFPTPPHEAARYTYDADPDQSVLQARLAEIDALTQLIRALTAMREPSGRRFFFDGRAAETWWEAGAFSLVRECATHLTRMSRNTSGLVGGASTQSSALAMAAMFDEMNSANSAYGRGDVEATVMHARLALFQRAAAAQDSVPGDLLERLARNMPRGDHANAMRLLEAAAQRTAAGSLPDIAVTALLAPLALSALGELLRAPQIFAAALTDGNSNG
ncbi:hypothetical protein [Catenulispora pinisilvae]|uniref:hypothetical protein n=1 Tax=Catenulispora pinisilvae TaxID=2705253 RepID=UPI0018916094|nr:hypothetical protein [Catenulispora pinisilvae]